MFLITFVLIVLSSSCSVKQVVVKSNPLPSPAQSFVGHAIADVIDVLGADFIQKTDGRGGLIYIWETRSSTTTGGSSTEYGYYRKGYNSYTPGAATNSQYTTYEKRSYIEVSVNPNNIVYKVNDNLPVQYKTETIPIKRGWYRCPVAVRIYLGYYTFGMLPLLYGLPSNSICHKWFNQQPEENQKIIANRYRKARKWYRRK